MLSHRMLILLWCAALTSAQLPKHCERSTSRQTVFVHVERVDAGPKSPIPEEFQREIRARVQRRNYEENLDSDYLQLAGDEIAKDTVAVLQERGYFRGTAKTSLTEVKKEGPDVKVDASISAELGPQYRLGVLNVMPADSDRALSLKPQALREEFRLQPGEILNADEIRRGLSTLRKAYLEYGFVNMSAEPEVKIDDAKNTINVVILVDEDRQYFVKDVQFLGVDPRLEERLRKKLPRSVWLFNPRVLENFFKENRSVLPADASLEEDVELHRNAKDATVELLLDLRPCPGGSNKR